MSNSCIGCKFLYGDGSGYSNYTWMDTWVRCAKKRNPALIKDVEVPFDMETDVDSEDKWPPTMNGRCDLYALGPYIILDPDREEHPSTKTDDKEQIAAICEADGMSVDP